MRRMQAIIGSAVFLVIAPGIVAGYVPWLLSRWQIQPPLLEISAIPVAGVLLILAGLPVLLDSFAQFAWRGLGTPAPVLPTQQLVVTGLFRYVRNPMYLAVAALIFGQGLLFGNIPVLVYGAAASLAFHLFVMLYEEPTLRRTYGGQYDRYCANVKRWIPRLRLWREE